MHYTQVFCTRMYMQVTCRGQRKTSGVCSVTLYLSPVRQVLSLNLELDQWLAPATLLPPSPNNAEIAEEHSLVHICFKDVDVGDLNSGSRAFTLRHRYPLKPSPQALFLSILSSFPHLKSLDLPGTLQAFHSVQVLLE